MLINTILNIMVGRLRGFWVLINRNETFSVFTVSLIGYGLLFFVPNDKSLLVLFVGLVVAYYWKTKSFWLAMWLVYLFFLPFERGKSLIITMVPASLRNGEAVYPAMTTFADIAFLVLLFLSYKDKVLGKNILKRLGKIDITLLLFLLCGLLTVFLTTYKDVVLLSFLRLTRCVAIFWITKDFLHRYKNKIPLVLSVISASVLFQGCWGVLQLLLGGPLGKSIEQFSPINSKYGNLAFENLSLFRPSGTFFDPNYLASYLTIVLPLFIAYLFVKKNEYAVFISLITLFVGVIALFVTQSRGAWFIFIGIIMIFIVYLKKHARGEMNILAKKAVSKLMLISLFFIPLLVIPRLNNFLQVFDKYGSGYYRFDLIGKSVNMLVKYPLGVGLGVFPAALINEYPNEVILYPASPHNLFAQIWSEMGIFGLLFFVIFIILIIKQRNKIIHEDDEQFCLRAGIYFSWLAFLGVANFYPLFLEPNIFDYFFILSAIL